MLSPWWQGVCDICPPCPCDPGRVARSSAAGPQNTKLHPEQCKQLLSFCCCIYPELVSHMLPHMAQQNHTRAERPLKTGDLSFPVGLSQDIISKQKLLVNVVLCYIRYLKVWPLDPSANEQPRALSGH